MSNQSVYKGCYVGGLDKSTYYTKIYTKKGLAINNTPKHPYHISEACVIEYELVPTGRKFNMKGELI